MPTSAAIWSRCGNTRSARVIRPRRGGRVNETEAMCNLYSIATNQAEACSS